MCFSSFVPCLPAGLLPLDQKQHPQIHSTFHSESASATPTSIITIAHVSPLTCKQVDLCTIYVRPLCGDVWWCLKPSFLGYGCFHRKPPFCWCCETPKKNSPFFPWDTPRCGDHEAPVRLARKRSIFLEASVPREWYVFPYDHAKLLAPSISTG